MRYFLSICVLAVFFLQPATAPGADQPDGAAIYKATCARCHGAQGQGTDEYPRALAGERSVLQLARLIAKTMPEDDPGTCVGADADAVAAYIHDAFYSPIAQARNKPARIELSRLTVRQYRNAVTDLVASFRAETPADDGRRGLKAEYYKGRGFRGNERVFERTDPRVAFDFGTAAPGPEPFEPHQFSVRWEGSVVPPETGEYEFIVKTDHAARLWVNDLNRALIDRWVKSGDDTEFRESLPLQGGRAYAVRLEFSKAKQGVADKNKDAPKPDVPASIALMWKPPRRAVEVVPERCLRPTHGPEWFVLNTPFPPDDRSIGYERGAAISKEWDQATTEAALETVAYIAARTRELYGIGANEEDREAKLRDFAKQFAKRAFRSPLTDQEVDFHITRQFAKPGGPDEGLKRALLLVLKSPRFLYRELSGKAGPYEVASRLSFGLWDSVPDKALLEAASKGELKTPAQVAEQARRMLADPRARSKVHDFLLTWLKVEQAPDLGKDPERFPDFSAEIAADLRTSLELFLESVVWDDKADFRRLLLDDTIYLNGRLARFYGADLPDDAPFQAVRLDPEARAGVLSHPYLMATFSYTASTSPIHRGVFIARGVLGQVLKPPPEAVAPLAPDLHPGLTTRERVLMQTSPQACQTCHSLINPLGFPLENFDAIGRFRDQERGRPIDATGSYQPRSGEAVAFRGARDLATFLARSEEVHEAFVEQVFHDLVKQPARAYGPTMLADLTRHFQDHDFHVRDLMVEIMARTALVARPDNP